MDIILTYPEQGYWFCGITAKPEEVDDEDTSSVSSSTISFDEAELELDELIKDSF